MPVAAVNGMDATASAPALRPVTPAPPPAQEANVSASGVLMSRLQRLAEQDPSALRSIATQAAETLSTQAAAASGETARGLNGLAQAFAQAATSGNVAGLSLAAGRGRLHHHASVAAKTYTGSSPPAAVPKAASAALAQVSAQVDQALGLSPPPLGPWLSGQ
jgi:hypothetical protein